MNTKTAAAHEVAAYIAHLETTGIPLEVATDRLIVDLMQGIIEAEIDGHVWTPNDFQFDLLATSLTSDLPLDFDWDDQRVVDFVKELTYQINRIRGDQAAATKVSTYVNQPTQSGSAEQSVSVLVRAAVNYALDHATSNHYTVEQERLSKARVEGFISAAALATDGKLHRDDIWGAIRKELGA